MAIDQNTSSLLAGLGNQGDPTAGPLLAHSVATVRLRADNVQIDVTMADTPAYALLAPDPYTPPDPAASNAADLHFQHDQPLLQQLAAKLFALSNNGAPLGLLSATVELTPTQDILFHLAYPRAIPGQLQLQPLYIDRLPPSQRILVEVLDGNHAVLGYSSLGPANPIMDVTLPAPPPPRTFDYRGLLGAVGALAGGGAVYITV